QHRHNRSQHHQGSQPRASAAAGHQPGQRSSRQGQCQQGRAKTNPQAAIQTEQQPVQQTPRAHDREGSDNPPRQVGGNPYFLQQGGAKHDGRSRQSIQRGTDEAG